MTILTILGKASAEDSSFVSVNSSYFEKVNMSHKAGKIDFLQEFNNVSKEGVNLLDRMLKFNPYFRSTAA